MQAAKNQITFNADKTTQRDIFFAISWEQGTRKKTQSKFFPEKEN